MEPLSIPYVAPNLTEIPQSLFLDFTNEFQPLRNLVVEFHPYYTERDMEKTVKDLFKAISHKEDIDYQLADFSMRVIEDKFKPYNCVSQHKLFELNQIMLNVGRAVFNKINGLSGYIYGIFPYGYAGMRFGSEVFLRNTSFLNHDIDLQYRPFQFAI